MNEFFKNKRFILIASLIVVLAIILTAFNTYHASHLGEMYPQFQFFVYASATISLLIGASITYIYESKIKNSQIDRATQFLPENERKICKILLKRNEVEQKKLASLAEISNVKTSRVISTLEERGVIEKKKHGYTNLIVLKI